MKKFLRNLGVFALVGFSFFYTEKITYVINDKDAIMIELKQAKKDILPIEPIIYEDTIIPGLNGSKINIKKSYQNMKKYGVYNDNLIDYELIKPQKLAKDKYIISGNAKKNMVSLMFKANEYFDEIINVLNSHNIKGTFFIDEIWLQQNGEDIYKLKNHTVGNGVEKIDSNFIWVNTTVLNILNQSNNYCYFKEKNKERLDNCYIQNNYSIIPTVINKNLYQEIIKNVKAGSLILIDINRINIKELNNAIKYLKNKGYILVDLQTHLES